MHIRAASPSDNDTIRTLTYTAFKGHPHHAPGTEPREHLIIDHLRVAGALTLSLVAEEDGEILGHLALSPVKLNGANCSWHGLGPVSVMPGHQSKGIGSELIREGLRQMKSLGSMGVVVLGEPDYYARFGFRHDETLEYPGVPAHYFMVQAFKSGHSKGEVTFHPAFC
ncbi:GNAT family N-acetyltransferase [Ferrimonas futtsuensis]|uniref:GNAT family N-acetyltransferase n=1 Tax=Ferrimonas futtsuensis TaxID=364764 RepID=UPI00047F9B67|nr:N-acetyltransferase [Ferrimonas futtsuensis]